MATIVTALYDIGRGNMKTSNGNRPFENYLKWFADLLQVDANMVIFVDKSLKDWVEKRRKMYMNKTKIITRSFEDLNMQKYSSKIMENMSLSQRNEIEFTCPNYVKIIFEKFFFLEEAIEKNYFETDYFFWVDAGYIRDGRIPRGSWPDIFKLDCIGEKILIQNTSLDINSKVNFNDYLSQNKNEIISYFFGGKAYNMLYLKSEIIKFFERMISEGLINNEQNLKSIIIREKQNRFLLYPCLRTREILIDFSKKGRLLINYPIFPNLKLFTVCTKKIPDNDVNFWIFSAKYYGYNFEILGRSDEWKGWPYRTQKYLDAVKNCKEEIICLTDSVDVFFAGPARELYEKFIKIKEDLIIGVERKCSYQGCKDHPYDDIVTFFNDSSDMYKYPNGGFLIGKKQKIIEILEKNKNSIDDQAGYMNLCYEGKAKIHRDTKTKLCANVTKYSFFTNLDTDIDYNFWKFDEEDGRYYNPETMEKPCVFHFPGSNYQIMQIFYARTLPNCYTHPDSKNNINDYTNNNNNDILLIIIIVVLIILAWFLFRINQN